MADLGLGNLERLGFEEGWAWLKLIGELYWIRKVNLAATCRVKSLYMHFIELAATIGAIAIYETRNNDCKRMRVRTQAKRTADSEGNNVVVCILGHLAQLCFTIYGAVHVNWWRDIALHI